MLGTAGRLAPPLPPRRGPLRRILPREVKAEQERAKSIILTAVFDDYVEKRRRMHRTENYVKGTAGAAPTSARFSIEKISDLKLSEIKSALGEVPSGNFNPTSR